MIDYEPASGYNLPPGCFDDDIERAFGDETHYCGACRYCVWSDDLDHYFCTMKLKDAMAKLKGTQRWLPEFILAAVEESIVPDDYYDDDCRKWEEE